MPVPDLRLEALAENLPAMIVHRVLVLGGGSAGLLAALTLKRKLPALAVRVVRSADIGIIGVGEGTTLPFRRHLFDYLGLAKAAFYAEAEPTWKLGLRFLWGPMPAFYYSFAAEHAARWPGLQRNNGFYVDHETTYLGLTSALMHHGKVFPRRLDGWPQLHDDHAFHIENVRLVAYLEARCRECGVEFTEGTVQEVCRAESVIEGLILENGERLTADLFVDASGFRAELIGRALGEPFLSYERTLWCDRAVIGGWARTDECVAPYTTCETMDAGWAWQIEHERWINRGYVFSSRFLDDEAARSELLRKNPKIDPAQTRVVKFQTGRRARMWVENVVAIGNASGFVEPLEATALGIICLQCSSLADILEDSVGDPTPSAVALWNEHAAQQWDDIRDFLAVHYAFNTRLNTAFWTACRAELELGGAAPLVEFFHENGPSAVHSSVMLRPTNGFGLEGYLALLTGQRVAHARPWSAPRNDAELWAKYQAQFAAQARAAMDITECLAAVRHPVWQW